MLTWRSSLTGVSHDILIDRLQKRIPEAGVIRVIRASLNSGIMSDGVVQERYQGTPQGGPLSPLLANVLLDEADSLAWRSVWPPTRIAGGATAMACSKSS